MFYLYKRCSSCIVSCEFLRCVRPSDRAFGFPPSPSRENHSEPHSLLKLLIHNSVGLFSLYRVEYSCVAFICALVVVQCRIMRVPHMRQAVKVAFGFLPSPLRENHSEPHLLLKVLKRNSVDFFALHRVDCPCVAFACVVVVVHCRIMRVPQTRQAVKVDLRTSSLRTANVPKGPDTHFSGFILFAQGRLPCVAFICAVVVVQCTVM